MFSQVQLIGGNFQDVLGTPVTNGTLRLVLSQSESADGYWYENLSPYTTEEVANGYEIEIPLDTDGNIVVSPPYLVYANNALQPVNSYYLVYCYDENGQLVWGPNCQNVFSSVSPLTDIFDVGQWVPNRIVEI